ncbi:serine/threonine-protein kinase [Ectopseudomonas toyotomiensis]|uniref:non-specific serine/threonine protein kinase n=1 Tax=Ectopseudomonas toyotomiensis TaxID=554344 RepID=A0AA42LIR7_9GAMM|nr:serine/threonine-protein kinase [Pseudomonas toyotomiensis]MBG0839754.1 protein kinase [Pseudomonas toyotomiensis]MDH0703532.1 serine/threonine-protein kinase [Pseudomonas toyotomiensis]
MDLNIPGFDIDRMIGEGAMATVYLALQRSLERKVALKIMAPALAADASFCERFLREGKTLARLAHPHIVTVHDIGNAGEHYYMAMEYLPNGTLSERIAAGLSPEQGLQYIRQIASALGYAHSQGLIHRDVKPANILFRADGTAVLSDFGIAKSLDDSTQFTQVGFAVGTPNYMSPEQARGLDIDGRADLYALGVVLYEILVGELPYMGTDALSTALAHLTQPLPELPLQHSRYQPLLQRLLAKNPDERFSDAGELLAALDTQPAPDSDATVIRPAFTQQTTLGAPSTSELGELQPVSIEIPRSASAPAPTVAPAPTATVSSAAAPPATSNKGPRMALLAVAVAAALGLGGGAYWWFGQPSTVVAADSSPQSIGQGAAVAPQAADTGEAGERPLLMPGKTTLYQRILAKPGAQLLSAPGAASGEALPAFSVLYVYARRNQDGQSWLHVGAASDGRVQGWIAAEQVADWKQSLVLKFTERSGRAPVLFMQQASDVERLIDRTSQARELLLKAQNDPEQVPQVVALEPTSSAVPQDQFYLMPIFDFREAFDAEGQPVQLLNIASIDPGSAAQSSAERPTAASDTGFRTGIVLVVDTSVSMQPYIDRVRQVVSELQSQLQARGELDNVSFGLVGYRNSTARTPGLQYLSKTLVSLEEGSDPQRFLRAAEQVQATTVSSHSFNEDAFAGVMQAVEGMDWSSYGGRLILLVSDAGALRKNDPYSSTLMNEAEVRQAALSKQIKVFALHLRTPAGKANHASAEQQYRVLTADSNPQIGDLYVSVPGGDVQAFGERVREIGSTFAELAQQVRAQQAPVPPQLSGGTNLAAKSQAIGYAMHMDFLGRRSASQAPQLVSAWTADRDLSNPNLPTLQVCVMLTKLQLNDLQQSLKLIVDAARKTKTSPADFFSEIASASAYMSRDPAALRQGANLAQSGVLGEYLDGLPYRSKALSMTLDLWLSLSVAEQEDFIDELESKIRLYETFHNDMANWVRFGNAEPGDALYRVPLSTLP